MAEIAQLLGHKDSRTTEAIYARFSPTYLRKAAATLEFV
jgi:integrase